MRKSNEGEVVEAIINNQKISLETRRVGSDLS
jgi:hypothetical protein